MNVNPYCDIISFGKYKGEIFDDVAEKDPSYIVWLHENVNSIGLPTKYVDAIRMDIMEEESEYLDAWGSWMSRYD